MAKLTPRDQDYSKWYNEIVVEADLAQVKGISQQLADLRRHRIRVAEVRLRMQTRRKSERRLER